MQSGKAYFGVDLRNYSTARVPLAPTEFRVQDDLDAD